MPRLALLLACCLFLTVPVPARAQDASQPAPIGWKPLASALETARKTGKKVLVDVYAPWCPWCRRMQREVYTDPAVQAYLKQHFVLTRLDADDDASTVRFQGHTLSPAALAQGLGATGLPTTVFLSPEGKYLTRLPGFIATKDFLMVLRYVGTNAYVRQAYPDFVKEQQGR